MNVIIRSESAHRDDLMDMLKNKTIQIIQCLQNNNIMLPDNSIKIWIKQFADTQFYPKIEIDVDNQELQYDVNHDGSIGEAHFKTFVKNGSVYNRVDIDKMQAAPLLIRIDNLIRY